MKDTKHLFGDEFRFFDIRGDPVRCGNCYSLNITYEDFLRRGDSVWRRLFCPDCLMA